MSVSQKDNCNNESGPLSRPTLLIIRFSNQSKTVCPPISIFPVQCTTFMIVLPFPLRSMGMQWVSIIRNESRIKPMTKLTGVQVYIAREGLCAANAGSASRSWSLFSSQDLHS